MRHLRALLVRLGGIFGRERREREFAAEMESHLELHIEDNLRAGMSPQEARRQALIKLGGVEQTKEDYRARRSLPLIETFGQDLRYAIRILRKSPGFTAMAVLTLGLGIGANTAIFSFVNGVLLRPLPYPSAGQLVRVFSVLPTQPHFPMALADFKDFAAQDKVFSAAALYAERDLDLSTKDRPEHLAGMGVSSDFFRVLGYHPALGRDFLPNEQYKGSNHVVILSDRLWRSRFASDPDIAGKSFVLSGELFTVVGVMPPGVQNVGGDFHSLPDGDTVDLWWPLPLGLMGNGCDRGCHFLNMIARLKPGVTVEQAGSELSAITAAIAKDYPDTDKDERILLVPLKEEIVGRARRMLLVLLGAVAFLLLIACVNVANLSIARATARGREVALRSVLGAERMRIMRQLLTESLLLALLGSLLGTALAVWGVDALVALSPEKLPRLHAVHVDAGVLGFTAAITILTALLFGLAPAIAILQTDMNRSLKDGDRGSTAGSGRTKLQNLLVTCEIALALVLLAGAGLLMRTFINLQHVEMGFQPEHVLTFRTNLPQKRYPDDESFARFYKVLIPRLQALPGVQFAAEGSDIPWSGYDENAAFDIEGRLTNPEQRPEARYHFASPDYFRAIGIPLLSGRFFTAADDMKSQKVMIVNSSLAQRYFSGEDAVGKRVNFWGQKGVTIVGVVGDVKDTPDAPAAKPALYWADWQSPQVEERTVVVRAASGIAALARAIPAEVFAIDKDLPVTGMKPMDEVAAHAISTARFTVVLVGSFAALAVLLAGVGIFGVMSCVVTQRTQEIGIRMALGAQQRDVLGMVVSQGAKVAGAGVLAGLAASLFLTKAMSGLLFNVGAFDLSTLLAVAALLGMIALAACYIPARRAMRVDPMAALHYE